MILKKLSKQQEVAELMSSSIIVVSMVRSS